MMGKIKELLAAVFREKKTKIDLVIILLTVTLILINIIFPTIENRYSLATDITRNRIYSLSETSNQILAKLEEDVYVYSICTPGQEDTRLQELLKEYSSMSSHLVVRDNIYSLSAMPADFTYPKNSSNAIMITNSDGTYSRTFTYEDMYIYDEDGNKTSFVAENKITAAIQGVAQKNFVNIRFLSGHGETGINDIDTFISMLDLKNYIISTYDFSTTNIKLNPKTDVLIIVSPKADLEQNEYDSIRDYMSNGGSILALIDRTSFNTKQGVLQKYASQLPLFQQLFENYSMQVNNDVIVSDSNDATGMRKTVLNAVVVRQNEENEIERNVILNEASSIDILDRSGTVRELLVSGDGCNAYTVDDNIEQNIAKLGSGKESYLVGAVSTLKESRIILITDSTCIGDDILQINGNYSFFNDVINELVPANQPVYLGGRPLDNINVKNRTKTLNKIFSYIVLLLIIAVPLWLIYCGFRGDSRRKSKR